MNHPIQHSSRYTLAALLMSTILNTTLVLAETMPSPEALTETSTNKEHLETFALELMDQKRIEQLIINWGHYRDQGMWTQLRETFHPNGSIEVSWYRGDFGGFVDATIEMAKSAQQSKHLIATPMITINGQRAISETNIVIMGRGRSGPIDIDITSHARFYDRLEKRDGIWRIVERRTIYEKDQIESVGPSFMFWIVSLFTDFDQHPDAYKHLAFALEKGGHSIVSGIIVNKSPEVKKLYQQGRQWLDTVNEAQ